MSDPLFHIVTDEFAILRAGGVYMQAPIYIRDGGLYAKHGAGYVRLMRAGGTSKPKLTWDSLTLERVDYDRLGRMVAKG